MTPADSEVTTPSPEAVLRLHQPVDDGEGFFCSCSSTAVLLEEGIATSYTPEHLAAVLQASFVLVPKDQLHQEWSNVFEKRKGTEWSERRTAGFPDRGVPDMNMRMNEANPVDWMRNMRIEVRLVGPWRPADSKENP
jgi:hypothetical protein